jgi:EAL domain-containing protein (putative c-di-GMP-specific phosphodiesterase class I)
MVENTEDAEFLIGAGLDCLQGYHFGMPRFQPDWGQVDREQRRAG